MTTAKRNNRRRTLALTLLFIVCSSMMIKALHYHHGVERTSAVYVVDMHQYQLGAENFCPICQYLFSPSDVPVALHFVFVALFLGVQYCLLPVLCAQKFIEYYRLRAPPATSFCTL